MPLVGAVVQCLCFSCLIVWALSLQFTYLDPSYFSIDGIINATDQHPDHDVLNGERLMKTVYEAIRNSPLWENTVLLIT